jgi:hypothetical protein
MSKQLWFAFVVLLGVPQAVKEMGVETASLKTWGVRDKNRNAASFRTQCHGRSSRGIEEGHRGTRS